MINIDDNCCNVGFDKGDCLAQTINLASTLQKGRNHRMLQHLKMLKSALIS